MFKQLAALVFLLAFVNQTFSAPFIMFNYYANTAAYAKNCINKAKPKLHCNGKCQAMKKIQEAEKKDQQSPERKSDYKTDVLSSKSFFCNISATWLILAQNKPRYMVCSLQDRTFDFFHPPKA